MCLRNVTRAAIALAAALLWSCGDSQPPSTGTPTPTPLVVSRVDVTPAATEINIGQSLAFAAQLYDAQDRAIAQGGVAWSSADPQVATVDGAGRALGVKGGNVRVIATAGAANGSGLLTVNPIPTVHSGRLIEWYQTQMGTGASSGNNCGPTSTQMAIRWYRNASNGIPAVEEIRSRHPRDGGWWYTSDISESLGFYGVPFATHPVTNEDDDPIVTSLRRGHIVLLCLEMKWISYNREPFYDRYYQYASGHFLIVKGLSEDGQYFVVYDPNNWNSDYYADQTAMGRNRYYQRSELLQAVTNWWAYAFEIGAPSSSSSIRPEAMPIGFAGPR